MYRALLLAVVATALRAPPRPEFHPAPDLAEAFFREEGRVARDLAVLAVSNAMRGRPRVRVVDACAGAGARALRYAADLEKSVEVLANEPNDLTRLEANAAAFSTTHPARDVAFSLASGDAAALLETREAGFDVVDVDAFGLSFDPAVAVAAAADGGVVLLATTGAAAAGARGEAARAALKKRLGCDACRTALKSKTGRVGSTSRCG